MKMNFDLVERIKRRNEKRESIEFFKKESFFSVMVHKLIPIGYHDICEYEKLDRDRLKLSGCKERFDCFQEKHFQPTFIVLIRSKLDDLTMTCQDELDGRENSGYFYFRHSPFFISPGPDFSLCQNNTVRSHALSSSNLESDVSLMVLKHIK